MCLGTSHPQATLQTFEPWSIQVSPWFGPSVTSRAPLRKEGKHHNRSGCGILPKTRGDQEINDLLEKQLYETPSRLTYPGHDGNPEATYLNPTPHGEFCDVMLNTVTGATMSRYPCIMLAGDMTFTRFFLFELSKAASHGSQILLHSRHIKAMGSDAFENLEASGNVTVIHAWENPQTGHPAAIANQELSRMSSELLPLSIEGDPIQFQVNRNHLGWVLECINNDGVLKTGDQAAKVYPEATAKVKIQPKFKPRLVREGITQNSMVLDPSNKISLSIPPGESRFVECLLEH